MISYPYYVPARIENGTMHKILGSKKYKTHNDAVEAMTKKYANLATISGCNMFLETQNVILEYTKEYQGRIISIYTDSSYTFIKSPQQIM